MRLIPQSLFGRLTLILIGALLLAQVVSFVLIHVERGESDLHSHLQQHLHRIAAVAARLDSQTAQARQQALDLLQTSGLSVTVQPRHSAAAAHQPDFLRTEIQTALGPPAGWWLAPAATAEFLPPGARFAVEVRLRDGSWARFDPPRRGPAGDWPHRLLIHLVSTLLAVVLASLLAMRWATRPLKLLAEAAATLPQDLNRAPLPEDGPREARQAAQAFNQMQRAVARLIDERTKALSAMSHDLRTPLTRLRLRLELLDDETLRQKMAADLQEMQQLTETTLDYLRGLSNTEPLRPVDIDGLLDGVLADLRDAYAVAVPCAGQARAPYPARPQALRRALMNLVDNAVKYGHDAEVRIEDGPTVLRLIVADHGPGIPEADIKRMREPFQRLEDSRNRDTGGVGLGLTIVQDIAALHGGRLLLANRPEGGLQATLELPRRPA